MNIIVMVSIVVAVMVADEYSGRSPNMQLILGVKVTTPHSAWTC